MVLFNDIGLNFELENYMDYKIYAPLIDDTPSFAFSLLKEYRNYGIGTELMKRDVMVNIQYVHFL